jgi:hypothetical protein
MARAAMFGLLIVPSALAAVVNAAFQTTWGNVLSLQAMTATLWLGLFRSENDTAVPAWLGAVLLGLICAACVALLARKVRAYEVVR